jgi:hypothetical protein
VIEHGSRCHSLAINMSAHGGRPEQTGPSKSVEALIKKQGGNPRLKAFLGLPPCVYVLRTKRYGEG